jgi:3-hydroxyacyl-[acyl-carrier-protein] dehydratase
MSYLFIDRILKLEKNKSIEAVKALALSEDYFKDHFAGYPVFPGALMIETLAQAGTALLEYSGGFKNKAILVMVHEAKFRARVRPGTLLKITGEITSMNEHSAQMDGNIFDNEKLVANALLTFSLVSVNTFYPEQLRFVISSLYDTWLEGAELTGF